MSDDKTEEPSQKKIDDARKQGNVWKSKDLTGAVGFAVAMGVIKSTWHTVEDNVKELFFFVVDHIAHPDNIALATQQLMMMGLTTLFTLCLPVALAAAIAGGLMDFLQVGSLFAIETLMPKLEKLNALEGLKNLFGTKQIVETAKSMAKLLLTGYVVFGVVRDSMNIVVATIFGSVALTMMVMGELVYRVVIKVVLLYIIFAIFDVWWQQKQYVKGLMMSKEDVKKEYKESEGDPHTKAQRKEVAREMLESAEMASVGDADVVVTNPDHVAVALKYDKNRDGAPRVICKGFDGKAQSIKQLARDADVPMLRNIPLAHLLVRVDVNNEIPEELYDAVAEVMNFVYQLQKEREQEVQTGRRVSLATGVHGRSKRTPVTEPQHTQLSETFIPQFLQ